MRKRRGRLRTADLIPPAYKAMWLFAMFDLPVTTKEARKEYVRFRKLLLHEGFTMLQFSVYARYCGNQEAASAQMKRLRLHIPPDGQVRLLLVTDHQFGKQEVYFGENREDSEDPPEQLMLF